MRASLFLFLLLCSIRAGAQLQSLPLVQQVMDHFNKGQYKEMIPVATRAVDVTKTELGEKSPFHSGMVLFLAMGHWYCFHYTEAEKWMLRSNELTLQYTGEQTPEYLSGLNRIAQLYREMGKFTESESTYHKTLSLSRSFTGGNDTLYGKSLSNTASYYQYTGQFKKAEELNLQAAALFKKLTGENSSLYATALNNLSTLYSDQGQYEKAKSLALKVLDLRKAILGEQHPDYAQSLNNTGFLFATMGQYVPAAEYYQKAVAIYRAVKGENDPDYASSISNLAELYLSTGEFDKSEQLYQQARSIRQKTVGENHPDYAMNLNNLATLYETRGEYEKAEQFFRESMDRTTRAFGEAHPAYVTAINNMAALYQTRGQYVKAEPLYLRARDIRKQLLGEQHPSYAMSLNNLGTLYLEIGQFDKALVLFREAGERWEKSLGPAHFYVALSWNNQAAVYEEMKQYAKAEPLYIRAMEIRKSVFGEQHSDYAISLNNLAALYVQTAQYSKAEALVLQANAIWQKILPSEHPNIALGMNNLAAIYRKGNYKFKEAEQLYLEAIRLRKKILGENHPLTADTENDLALLYMNQQAYQKAEPLLLASSNKTRQHLQATFPVLSEKEKANYINDNLFFSDCNNSYLYQHPAASSVMINNNVNLQLFFKSLSLADTRIMLEGLRNSQDDSLKRLANDWQKTRSMLAAQYALPAAKRMKNLPELETAAERMEKSLNRLSADFRKQQSALQVSVSQVRSQLETDEAAIEFVSFNYYHRGKTDSIIYAACIITKADSTAKFLPLFEEKQLQAIISRAGRSATAVARSLYGISMDYQSDLAAELYRLLWQPLEPYLKGLRKIAYSPAGKLYGIAFHALPAGEGKILQDLYDLRQYVSTREIAFRSVVREQTAGDIALFGDADFNMDSMAIAQKKPAATSGNELALRGGNWPELPFTRLEVDSIRQLFVQHGKLAKTYLKAAASEEAIKEMDGSSPAALHIATHGFYVPEAGTSPTAAAGRGVASNNYKLSADPLLRNGLILAGGNYAWAGHIPLQGTDDGVLTAYEIAQLNLSRTRLVVLSACETALGDIKGTEGVFGLQRAFKMAGTDKMILSLWQVPDKETAALMTAFYFHWLEGKNLREAFHLAQASMRKQFPAFSWAAFVLVE